MIFVTVGTDRGYGFDRLIRECDRLAPALQTPFVMQIAATKYEPANAQYFRYIRVTDYWDYFKKADLIISHCSSGPVLNAMRFQKPLIIVPRRSAYNEFADEHQLDFARTLETKNLPSVKVLYELEDLDKRIMEMQKNGASHAQGPEGLTNIIQTIGGFLRSLET